MNIGLLHWLGMKSYFKIIFSAARKQKQRKEEQTRVPRSLFDRPSAQLLKMRREHKLKSSLLKPFRPVPPVVKQPSLDQSNDHPEWLIHEDWALLQVLSMLKFLQGDNFLVFRNIVFLTEISPSRK